jgi:Domain of unknown function (DUF4604)
MSNPKITPKNLSYDSSLPPFLQRLHNSSTLNGASLDGRHERAIARPKRARDANADKEDEPVFVDEETGEVVSGEQLKALVEGEQAEPGGTEEELAAEDGKEETAKEKDKQTATIGASRKRKAAKVIGGDVSDEDTQAASSAGKEKRGGQAKIGGATEKKAKGKGKKVKLSFGDDEEG